MIATVIPGEVPVFQTGQDVARKLLVIASDHGYSLSTVRSIEFGFMVPAEVARVFNGGESNVPREGVFFPPPKQGYWTPERRKAQGEKFAEYRRRKAMASTAGGS